jgi:hypothetical protein
MRHSFAVQCNVSTLQFTNLVVWCIQNEEVPYGYTINSTDACC